MQPSLIKRVTLFLLYSILLVLPFASSASADMKLCNYTRQEFFVATAEKPALLGTFNENYRVKGWYKLSPWLDTNTPPSCLNMKQRSATMAQLSIFLHEQGKYTLVTAGNSDIEEKDSTDARYANISRSFCLPNAPFDTLLDSTSPEASCKDGSDPTLFPIHWHTYEDIPYIGFTFNIVFSHNNPSSTGIRICRSLC